jgi:hypothetical protein
MSDVRECLLAINREARVVGDKCLGGAQCILDRRMSRVGVNESGFVLSCKQLAEQEVVVRERQQSEQTGRQGWWDGRKDKTLCRSTSLTTFPLKRAI